MSHQHENRRLSHSTGFIDPRIRTEGLNPSELLHGLRALVSSQRSPGSMTDAAPVFDRVGTATALNARLSTSARGRLFKRVANGMLASTRLGDGLKAIAINP